jgi:hypothetical protein
MVDVRMYDSINPVMSARPSGRSAIIREDGWKG